MANVFGILTTILLIAGAFIAHKNKQALESEIAVTGISAKDLKTNLNLQTKLKGEITELETQTTDLNSAEAELAQQLAIQMEENAAVQAKIESAEKEAAAMEAQVADANDKLKDTGDLDNLLGDLEATNHAIARLTEDVAVNEAKVSQLENTKTATTSRLTALKEVNRVRRTGEVPADLDARVRSVYRNWGFVTIGAGDNDNVMKDSVLQVTRDGQPIAKIKITAVEANTAAGNIIADSVAEGESISSGDRVSALPAEAIPASAPTPTPGTPIDPPAGDLPIPADPGMEAPAVDEPAMEEPSAFGEDPAPSAEEPAMDEPAMEEPSAFGEDPAPSAEEPAMEEPAPSAEDPASPALEESPNPL